MSFVVVWAHLHWCRLFIPFHQLVPVGFFCITVILTSTFQKSQKVLLRVFQLRVNVGGKALAAMSAKEQAGHVQCLESVLVLLKLRNSWEVGGGVRFYKLCPSEFLRSALVLPWWRFAWFFPAYKVFTNVLSHTISLSQSWYVHCLGRKLFRLSVLYCPFPGASALSVWKQVSCIPPVRHRVCAAFLTGNCLDCRDRWEQKSCVWEPGWFCLLWTGCPGLAPASSKAPGSPLLTHCPGSPIREGIRRVEIKNLWLEEKLV